MKKTPQEKRLGVMVRRLALLQHYLRKRSGLKLTLLLTTKAKRQHQLKEELRIVNFKIKRMKKIIKTPSPHEEQPAAA